MRQRDVVQRSTRTLPPRDAAMADLSRHSRRTALEMESGTAQPQMTQQPDAPLVQQAAPAGFNFAAIPTLPPGSASAYPPNTPAQRQAHVRIEPTMPHPARVALPVQRVRREHEVQDGSEANAWSDAQRTEGGPLHVPVQRYPYINSDPPARQDAQIYGIYKMNKGTIGKLQYVGQTTDARVGTRFIEHVKLDNWAPWSIVHGLDYSSENEGDWPYVPRQLEGLKTVTKFETTAAEQWWIEKEGGIGTIPWNSNNAILQGTFLKYKDIAGNYDPTNIGVSAAWKPKTT